MFEVNSFQVPNILVDEYLNKLNGNDLKVLLVIIRKTKGWNKEYDGISISQFKKFTGIKDERTIKKSLKKLIELSLIEKIEQVGKFSLFRIIPPAKNEGGQKMNGVQKMPPPPPAKNEGTPPAKNAPHNNTLPKNTNTKNNNKDTNKEETFKEALSKKIISLLKENNLPIKSNTKESWRITINNLIKEGYDVEVIEEAIEYASEDKFYCQFLVNPVKFKNNIDAIVVRMNKEKEETYVGF